MKGKVIKLLEKIGESFQDLGIWRFPKPHKEHKLQNINKLNLIKIKNSSY